MLSVSEGCLQHGETRVKLPPKGIDLLICLAREAPHLVAKDALFAEVWPDEFVEDGTLYSTISRLRKKLNEHDEGVEYIEIVPKKGYRFIQQVEIIQDRREARPMPRRRSTFRRGFFGERLLGLNGTSFLNPGDLRLRISRRNSVPSHLSHEHAALQPLRSLVPGMQYLSAPFIEAVPEDQDSIVSSGAPVSNDVSGLYLPVFALGEDPSPPRRLAISRDALPYHFATGESHSVKVISGSQGGRLTPKRNNAVVEWHEKKRIRRPVGYIDREGKLGRDYLLVSRMPRTTSGGEILIIAGLHGPATQAFELVFDPEAFPEEEVRWLAEQVGDEPYFQAVLEADEIEHEQPMSRATRLRVSRLLPPQPIYITPEFFKKPDE